MNRAVLITLLAACADPYDVDDYWRELGRTHCEKMEDCCTADEYFDWWHDDDNGDEISCVGSHSAPIYASRIREGIAEGRIAFDAAAARSCLDALASNACATFEPAYRYRETYCQSPLVGTISDGAGCVVNEECASGMCEFEAAGPRDVGICRPRVPEGAHCSITESLFCERPFACQADGFCGLGKPAGQSCDYDAECVDDWCEEAPSGTEFCRRVCDGK